MNKPDILIFMSDQHSPYFSGYFGGNVDTPNMDDMAKQGVNFSSCYSACPLCVPSRMSMLSTLLPHKTGIYTNGDTLSNTTPTFLHPLVEQGYETVLIGRMHFIGSDQRHGFTNRIAPDITETTWSSNREESIRQKGKLFATFIDYGATKVVGAGESPVIHYDNMVIKEALKYLSEEHDKPQCIVVGTYGPHFPYIARPDLFDKYYEKAEVPEGMRDELEYMNEVLLGRRREVTDEVAKGCVAAYSAQVELQDELLGKVRRAFQEFCDRRSTKRVMMYLSDHGDQVGDRMLFGKNTFFEKSVRVPFLIEGDNICQGIEISDPVSLLDVGPTLWDLTEAQWLTKTDGVSLSQVLAGGKSDANRVVFSELIDKKSYMPNEKLHYASMVINKKQKFIKYWGDDETNMLFDLECDPKERINLYKGDQSVPKVLLEEMDRFKDYKTIIQNQIERGKNKKLFEAYDKAVNASNDEMWAGNPPTARGQLVREISEPWDGKF